MTAISNNELAEFLRTAEVQLKELYQRLGKPVDSKAYMLSGHGQYYHVQHDPCLIAELSIAWNDIYCAAAAFLFSYKAQKRARYPKLDLIEPIRMRLASCYTHGIEFVPMVCDNLSPPACDCLGVNYPFLGTERLGTFARTRVA